MSSEHDGERQERPQDPATTRRPRTLTALLLTMLASWLLLLAPLPYSLAAGVTALAAMVLLVLAAVQTFRQGRHVMAVLSLVVGVPATLMIVTGSLLSLLFYGPMLDIQECHASALTEHARSSCTADAQDSMATWVSELLGG
ncbi:hypothetical protein [Brachybacterium alimentarium]|uniref:hypothetical protein n=1 Tax=Brachybacterium alimentarium TaxID=47845 RepID=UPI000DF2A3A1|nr:hypothetical protein [Brachybacterium alimentarium]RCS94079.1 hypothetical protein CIK69_00360 [Brachybacterium alimentarium]